MKLQVIATFLIVISVTLLSGCAGIVLGGAAAGIAVAHDRRTTGSVIEDQAIEVKVMDKFFNHPKIAQQTHLRIISYNQHILLVGEAPNAKLVLIAEEMVKKTPKVKKIYNEIILSTPNSIKERSLDSLISTKVKASLFTIRLPHFDPTRIKVITANGIVYLMGLVTRKEAKIATEKARRVSRVKLVVKLFQYVKFVE